MAKHRVPPWDGFETVAPCANEGGDDTILWPIDVARVLIIDFKTDFEREPSHVFDQSEQGADVLAVGGVEPRLSEGLAIPKQPQLAFGEVAVITPRLTDEDRAQQGQGGETHE